MIILPCTVTCENLQFRGQRQVVELESRYVTLSMNMDLKNSKQSPLKYSKILFLLLEKLWRLGGKQVVLLMGEDFGPCTARCKNYTTLQIGQHKEVELTHKEWH
jgi:hypothetical protein